MLMMKISAVALVAAGIAMVVAGAATGMPVLVVVGAVLAVTGVGMLVLDRKLAPLMQTSRELTESRGMATSRLTGAPTMRSSMRYAAERTAQARQSMAAFTGDPGLRTKGVPGRAEVTAARDTGDKRNMNPVFELDLVVTPENARAYTVTIQTEVNTLAVAQCVPGTMVPVKVDPDDQSKVWVDWMAVAGGAAQGT